MPRASGSALPQRPIALWVWLLLSACAQPVWVKSGATAADFQVAKGRWLAAGYSQVPSAPSVAAFGTSYISPSVTNCTAIGNIANCVATGGQYVPPVSIPYDANAGVRAQVFQGCMYSEGWSLEDRRSGSITASAPPISPWTSGYQAGVAKHDRDCNLVHTSWPNASEEWSSGCRSGQNDALKGP